MDTHVPMPGAKLALALCKAQAKIKPPIKNRHVDFEDRNGRRVKYSYADLADVIESLRQPFIENELSYSHLLEYSEAGYGMKTILIHSSGEYLQTWYPLPDPKAQTIRAQEFGSALTYARRYSLSSLVGIASEEDDDGAGAAVTEKPKPKPPLKNHAPQTKPQAQPKPKEESQEPATRLEQFYAAVDKAGFDPDAVKETMKRVLGYIKKSTELSEQELEALLSYFKLSGN